MNIVHLALGLLRIAGEALFLFELNRVLGALVVGGRESRARTVQRAESSLLSCSRTCKKKVKVVLADGTVIQTLVAGPEGTPLVLLHGHSMCAAFFFRNFDALVDMGFHVYAPDLPGWGSSSRPLFNGQCAKDGVAFYADRIYEWLDVLGLQRFVLCGHSLGAYLAHEIALKRPDSVQRLVLTSPAAIMRGIPFSRALWFALTPQRLMTQGGLLALMLFSLLYPSDSCYNIPGLRDLTLCINSLAHGSGDAAAARLLRIRTSERRAECERPLLERVGNYQCRVELICGDRDELVDVEAVRALHRAMLIRGNDVKLSVISGADHSPHICVPDLFAKAMVRATATLLPMRSPVFPMMYKRKSIAVA